MTLLHLDPPGDPNELITAVRLGQLDADTDVEHPFDDDHTYGVFRVLSTTLLSPEEMSAARLLNETGLYDFHNYRVRVLALKELFGFIGTTSLTTGQLVILPLE